jgi:CRISPR system Cascade subunit CasC
MSNAFTSTRIEYHILQSFPVTCLNRDDNGAPKTAVVGGVNRARVSSQCWKRQVRLAMGGLGCELAVRTKKPETLFADACQEAGASEDQAKGCGEKITKELVDDTLLFISPAEAAALAEHASSVDFDAEKLSKKEIAKVAKKAFNPAVNGLDVALFGRMVASAPEMGVEAAASFSHAISTHAVNNDIEFFTALDDLQEEPGSAHMGTLEFNSATYYRYISLDLGQLAETVGEGENLARALEAFTKALFIAVPDARQTTQSGASAWDFARVLVRKGQRLQVPFDSPVRANQGHLQPSIAALTEYIDKKAQLMGSLYGEMARYDWGLDETFSVDDLIGSLKNHVQ